MNPIRVRAFLAFVFAVLLSQFAPWRAFGQIRDGAPIDRPYAAVALSGSEVPTLLGKPRSAVRAVRWNDTRWESIPVQVDCRNEDGALLFPFGPDPDPVDPDGPLGAGDEIVFMAFDAGPAAGGAEERELPAKRVHRVTVRDPATGNDGEVFLFADATFPESKRDYVSFDEKLHRTRALGYQLGSRPGSPALVEYIEPGSGTPPRNIIDRLKLRARGKLFGIFPIERDESDIISELAAYIDGPVRTVRRMNYALRAIWNIRTPFVERDTPAYAYHASFPNEMKVPFRLGTVFSEALLLSGFDFRPAMGEADLYCDDFAEPVRIDGRMSEREKTLGQYNPVWWVVRGEAGCIVFYLVADENLAKTGVESRLAYTDDVTQEAPPENVPGSYGQVLYEIDRILDVERGSYRFDVEFYFPPVCGGEPRDAVLAEWDAPLSITVDGRPAAKTP